ncbi:MAG: hypothetical protein LBH96_07095 [Candidatus Peribacteria bacterium]|jgi:hypothetical protein|nr:hypothetical protein [Candidatus Peribacteria bacterium]
MGKWAENHTFKTISSITKNTNVSEDQLNGIRTTKFGTGSHLTNYYQRIIKEIASLSGNRLDTSGTIEQINTIGNKISINLSGINTELDIIQTLKNTNNTGAIPTHITNIEKILQQNKFSISSGDTTSLEELYNLLQSIEINTLLSILQTIQDSEYETLVINKQKIEFAS